MMAKLLGRHTSQSGRIAFHHDLKQLGSRKPTAFLLAYRCMEASKEHILQQRLAIEPLVSLLKFPFFLLGQIVTFTIHHLLLQLGIKLLMIQGLIRYESFHLYTEETTASGYIAQNLAAIGRANEGCQTRLGTYPNRLPRYTGMVSI